MIEMFDPGGDVLEKMLPSFRQPHAAMAPLEQENSKILFELLDPRADRGLAHAQGGRGMTKVQMLRDRQCMNQ